MKKCALWLCSSALLLSACADNIEDTRTLELPVADATVADTAVDASAAHTAFAPAMRPDAAEGVLQSAQTAPQPAGGTIQNRDGELARVPLFALIPVGPSQARLLWVPWTGAGVRYSVEHSPPGTLPKWTPIRAEIDSDSALVSGVGAADQLRVVAWNDENVRVGESVDLAFSPVEAAEPLLAGRNVIDGRAQGWMVGETLVSGLGSAPHEGDILLLPMAFELGESVVREVISTSSADQGWSATTRPFEWRPNQGARSGAAANLSLDGLPVGLLQPGSDGYRGYCSVSGWGCVEFLENDLIISKSTSKSIREYRIIDLSWSSELSSASGLSITPEANAGVKILADGSANGSGRARITAYADGSMNLNISTTDSSIEIPERRLFTTGRVKLFTVAFFTLRGEVSLAAVAGYEGSTGGTEGQWSGSIQFSRGYEVGFERRRKFYKDRISSSNMIIAPSFGDESRGAARVGLKAVATIDSYLVDAQLTGNADLVLSHSSTRSSPCMQEVSIEATDIALESGLRYWINFIVGAPFEGTLLSERTPIAAWAINRSLLISDRLRTDAAQQFRVLSDGNPQPQDSGGSPMPPIDWAGLEVYVDGALAPQPTSISGRYQFAEALTPGDHEVGVWVPELDHGQALRAPGVCLTRSVTVEGTP